MLLKLFDKLQDQYINIPQDFIFIVSGLKTGILTGAWAPLSIAENCSAHEAALAAESLPWIKNQVTVLSDFK